MSFEDPRTTTDSPVPTDAPTDPSPRAEAGPPPGPGSAEKPRKRRAWLWVLVIALSLSAIIGSCAWASWLLIGGRADGLVMGNGIAVIPIDGAIAGTGSGAGGVVTPRSSSTSSTVPRRTQTSALSSCRSTHPAERSRQARRSRLT